MCADFTNLKKACPKTATHFLMIDKLVNSELGYKLLSFMDAFQVSPDPFRQGTP